MPWLRREGRTPAAPAVARAAVECSASRRAPPRDRALAQRRPANESRPRSCARIVDQDATPLTGGESAPALNLLPAMDGNGRVAEATGRPFQGVEGHGSISLADPIVAREDRLLDRLRRFLPLAAGGIESFQALRLQRRDLLPPRCLGGAGF